MVSIKVRVSGTSVVAEFPQKLTSGMVGLPVEIEYDESWNGLYKTASFRSGNLVRSRENIGTYTTVPWEVMRNHGKSLEVGIEGRDENGDIIIPTVWATVGTIQQGAVSSVAAAPNPGLGGMVQPGVAIDDSQISVRTTWSSQKISNEIENDGAVLYTPQNLTEEQKQRARENIGTANASVVVFHIPQSLTKEQKAQARYNIGGADASEVVLHTVQNLTYKQKQQARENIRAAEKPHKKVTVRQEFRHETNVDVSPGSFTSSAIHPQQTWMENPDAFAFNMTVTIGDKEYSSTQSDFTITETSAEEGTGLRFTPIDDPDIVAISFSVTHSSDRTDINFPSYSTNASVCLRIYENILEYVDLNIATSVNGVEADADGNVALDAVLYAEQNLTAAQQDQARKNIGAPSQFEVDYLHSRLPSGELVFSDTKTKETHTIYAEKGALIVESQGEENKNARILTDRDSLFLTEQDLTAEQKNRARRNIDAAHQGNVDAVAARLLDGMLTLDDKKNDDNMVLYAEAGNLRMKNNNTNETVTFSTGGGVGESVLYTAQTLTADQKEQARANIGAASADYCYNRLPMDGSVLLYDGDDTDPYTLTAHNDVLKMIVGRSGKEVVFLTKDNMQEIVENVISVLPIYSGEVEEV